MTVPAHPRSTQYLSRIAALAVTLALVAAGCPKRIGDGCTQSIECSLNADRRCDLAQPGGYCTIPECDPDRCPDQAMCIEFVSNVSRLARRFCMQNCNVSSECRSGYTCVRPQVLAPATCPPIDPTNTASYPPCNRLLDTARVATLPTGYCVETTSTSDAGVHDP
ncbi:MAG: hypothetical protein WCJ30_28400 [Deltaproteobacteria bacterium]